MNKYYHAQSSVKKWGGEVEDYLMYHAFFDQTKNHVADQRHRLILHNSFGIGLLEKMYGDYFVNSHGKEVPIRKIGEQHVLEDLGQIPSLYECLLYTPDQSWLGGIIRQRQLVIVSDDIFAHEYEKENL